MRFGRTVEEGFLPVFSVPTIEDADELLARSCRLDYDGETWLCQEIVDGGQTLENLEAFAVRLAENWNRKLVSDDTR